MRALYQCDHRAYHWTAWWSHRYNARTKKCGSIHLKYFFSKGYYTNHFLHIIRDMDIEVLLIILWSIDINDIDTYYHSSIFNQCYRDDISHSKIYNYQYNRHQYNIWQIDDYNQSIQITYNNIFISFIDIINQHHRNRYFSLIDLLEALQVLEYWLAICTKMQWRGSNLYEVEATSMKWKHCL